MWSKNISFESGVLHLSGIPAAKLAQEFGTPAFFLDENAFKSRALAWNNGLRDEFGDHAGTIFYAAKSFISTAVAQWIEEIGIGIDVCTGGELAVALAGGINPARIEVHGNNKSVAEIDRAVVAGVKTIVMDSLFEIERVAAAAKSAGKVQRVLLRLTPGIQAHTHESIATAHEDVKFGFSIASGAAMLAAATALNAANITLEGVHCHIGSQIFDETGHILAVERLVKFIADVQKSHGVLLHHLDFGGGFGIAYVDSDDPMDIESVLTRIHDALTQQCAKYEIEIPSVAIEPGRAIVGPAMVTLYRVGTVKDVLLEDGKTRTYISVDGGMSDNIRPSLYGAEYSALLANRNSNAPAADSRVVGKHCESGDIVIRQIALPSDIVPGDILAIPATGAYGRSMASNYNHILRPPVVVVADGTARTIIRREKISDLLALEEG